LRGSDVLCYNSDYIFCGKQSGNVALALGHQRESQRSNHYK